jgi:hypothetical protein
MLLQVAQKRCALDRDRRLVGETDQEIHVIRRKKNLGHLLGAAERPGDII